MSEKKDSENQKYFQHGWLTEPEFKEWLAKVKDTTTFRCFACNKTLELSTSGRSALTDHAKGEKHKIAVEKRQNVFNPCKKKIEVDSTRSDEVTIKTNKNRQVGQEYMT